MANSTLIVIIILAVNLIASLIVLFTAIISPSGLNATRFTYGLFFFFCPVVAPTVCLFAFLMRRVFHSKLLDASNLSFSKERENLLLPPDRDTEMNYVPVRDALVLEDNTSLRRLLLDLLKNNALFTTSSVSLAVESADAETSHYAASAITDFLSEFRSESQGMLFRLKQTPYDVALNLNTLKYIHDVLVIHVMGDIEQRSYIYVEESVAENLYTHNMWYMTSEHYLWITDLLLEINDYTAAEQWIKRAKECRPDELNTAKCAIHMYYKTQNRPELFRALDAIKASNINIDKEMLDLIRVLESGGDGNAQ